jgi:phosphoglycolate phosphatase-like HAD superfamily hydrolase
VKVLALDFDGVISDSAPESFVVALRTFVGLHPESKLVSEFHSIADADGETIRGLSLYRNFLELMPLGNRAEDFGVALGLLEKGQGADHQGDFDNFRELQGAEALGDFHRAFYRERECLRAENPDGWLALLGPYEEFVALLQRRVGDRLLALATAKDRYSVDILLAAYGISELFSPDRILDKTEGRSKRAHLRILSERLDVALDQITFVDDKLNHLEDVSGLGVRCVLAGWGYNGDRERRRALAQGFLVSDLAGAEEHLFAAPAAR